MDLRTKWNDKYKDRIKKFIDNKNKPNERLENLSTYFTGGKGLDLACGLGANSLFLAQLGYNIQALDISEVATQYVRDQAREKQLDIVATAIDLTNLSNLNFKKNLFDLVIITYYLDRDIFPYVKSIIKDNGYFFMETFYLSEETKKVGISNKYKLHSNELLSTFTDWQVLYYEENEKEGRQTILVKNKSISNALE
ncbi:hypothetical protein BKP45_13940 [Anaerobacillus alkalidiazotrophicus]|uniref:Tellurite resistance methyltransferase TehB-like domain-containing protein n=1 Tax=Anaerobacillus alkalidiazotrophicus TaxID=472963 RepID=A0A1S2M6G9_9BACI|nr:methyltransferase domain-containing protein [Anaerobacillus alkalidiazotrophicus]OIJ19255.1 hypothetical protein BKP45_13940 [Anaerobacillus alkalidiazotrophicus]